jgi:FAD:protein FMN transferase
MLTSPVTAEIDCLPYQRMRPMLGTYVVIGTARHDAVSAQAVAAAFDGIERVQRWMSFHDPASELSRLNRSAYETAQAVSPATRRVLRAALGLARASEGRFDPTVAGRLVTAGFLPAPAAERVDAKARWSDVRWLPDGRIRFDKRLWLDLGGIAKGFAVDLAVRILWQHGLRSGVVNAGGDLRVFGASRQIDVRDPTAPQHSIPLLRVQDAAVATSAGYFSPIPGNTALMDADSGQSLGLASSVTVCAPRAIWADALTKVVLADEAIAVRLLRRLHAQAVLSGVGGWTRTLA